MRNPKIKPWLDEGIKRIAVNGLLGLKVSEIADELKISKSSFYHYFNTKEEYIEQLIEYWEEEGTINVIKQVLLQENLSNPVIFLLTNVFDYNFENECVLQQFRVSVGINKNIKKKVEEIDQIRISFLIAMLSKSGYSGKDLNNRARQIYRFFLGTIAHCRLVSPNKKEKQQIMEDFTNLFGKI
jgi:AcrR family transcriptional regulator